MTRFLVWLTSFTSLIGLAITLCLGLYLVTRTPRSRLSWLAALTLWALSGFTLYTALLVARPDSQALALFRPTAALALALGFHLTLLLPPGAEPAVRDFYLPPLHLPPRLAARLGTRAPGLSRLAVPLAYTLAILLPVLGAFPLGLAPDTPDGPALYLSERVTGPLYAISLAYLALLEVLALLHLWTRRQAAAGTRDRRRFTPLFAAALLTGLAGLYLGIGTWLDLRLPSVPGDVAAVTACLILAYTVARHHATVEGRILNRDLLYIALIIGAFTLSYIAVAEVLYLGGHTFSTLTLILIVVVAVSSLMLYDGLRTTLDRLFYRQQFRELRANLRALAREAGMGQSLPDRLQAVLAALCRTLGARRGLIALRRDDGDYVCQASVRAHPAGHVFPAQQLQVTETVELSGSLATRPEGLALLVPLYAGDDQIGTLGLGTKESGTAYGDQDLLLLDDVADQLAALVETMRLQEANARTIATLVTDFRQREHALQRQVQQILSERDAEPPAPAGLSDQEFVTLVEDALRHLHDLAYLGSHTLAGLAVVAWRLDDARAAGQAPEFVTHLDQGKMLSQVMVQALAKLRPDGPEPARHDVPPRTWHQYLILHGAYVDGELNRDIMNRLYISEGTFNRTRRRALRGLSLALREMEREAHQRIHATTP
ncbi:MAG: GAF domain-containing protein [Anaerolineae bacterium]|nr:GAF domain-containing protein [Anaerolineae bacterium]